MWGAAKLGLAFMILAANPALAQLDAATAQEGAKGRALLICAILAAEGSETIRTQASDLAFQGVAASQAAMSVIMQEMKASPSLGPLSGFIKSQDASFLIALSFSDATQEVKKLLDEVAPYGGGISYNDAKTAREWQADLEFKKRNCGFL